MDKELRTALDRCLFAMTGLLPSTYQSVLTAKIDLEVAVMALDTWLEEHVLDQPAFYHPSCSACLRGLAHTQLEHDIIVELREKRT